MSNQKRVLMIEDEPDFLRIYQDLLTNNGFEVLVASDGQKGLDLAFKEQPDLILLDLVLPSLTGMQVLQQLKANPDTKIVPVIVFSIMGENETIQQAIKAGANDYAVKGFTRPVEILKKINNTLSGLTTNASIKVYQLEVVRGHDDAVRLQQEAEFGEGLACRACKTPLKLELVPDYTRPQEHWFFAHFICPRCHTLN